MLTNFRNDSDQRPQGALARRRRALLEPQEGTVATRQERDGATAERGRQGTTPTLYESAPVCSGGTGFALKTLGREADVFEKHARTALRRKALHWAAGLFTAAGRSRGARIAFCGHLRPAIGAKTGAVGMTQVMCRDRACPACQRLRSLELGHALRGAVEHRQSQGDARLLFITLTVPKLPHSKCPAVASLNRLLDYWTKLSRGNSKRGRKFLELFPGGVRTVEVSWSKKGDRYGAHEVLFDGFHVHLHLLAELGAGVRRSRAVAWLVDQWCALTGAKPDAQNIQDMDVARVGQLTKYVTKPLEDAASRPEIARELFGALHGRRLIHGWGSWKNWKQWAELEPNPRAEVLLLAVMDLGQLEVATRPGLPGRHDTDVVFVGYPDGDRLEKSMAAVDVWDAIEADPRTFSEKWNCVKEIEREKKRKKKNETVHSGFGSRLGEVPQGPKSGRICAGPVDVCQREMDFRTGWHDRSWAGKDEDLR